MKKSLSIPTPCSQKWSNLAPTTSGRFCGECNKNVIDFTKMTEDQVAYLLSRSTEGICGRFRTDQLKVYSEIASLQIRSGLTLFKAGFFFSLTILLVGRQTFAQPVITKPSIEVGQQTSNEAMKIGEVNLAQIIDGVVKSGEDNSLLAGVNVLLKGTEYGTVTGVDGKFQFSRELKEGDILVFSFIDLETQEYIIPKALGHSLEIKMMMSELVMLGAVAFDEIYPKELTGFKKWWGKVKDIF